MDGTEPMLSVSSREGRVSEEWRLGVRDNEDADAVVGVGGRTFLRSHGGDGVNEVRVQSGHNTIRENHLQYKQRVAGW